MSALVILILSALAGARVWRLLALDDIGRPFRDVYYRVFNNDRVYHYADALLTCPFCLGFWVTAAFVLTGILWGGTVWLIIAGAFAANYVGAQLNAWLDIHPLDDKTEIGDHDE